MKVLLVDDHPLVLAALQAVIQSIGATPPWWVWTAPPRPAPRWPPTPTYDLVLLDLALGDADGFDVLVEFRAAYPAVPVVVVSASDRASDVIRAIDSGAMGFVPKKSSHAELHEALRMVMTGSMYVPPSMLGLEFGRSRTDGDTVPSRDAAFGRCAAGRGAHGPTAPEVASHRRRRPHAAPGRSAVAAAAGPAQQADRAPAQPESVETVKDHVAAVLRALGVSSRTQAVLAVSQMTQGQGGFSWRHRR
jgi:DNA-binding NarL/FixJ family response regulator